MKCLICKQDETQDGVTTVTLERGAFLRDIGKLRVPNDILLKDGVLTYDEWVTLQQHTSFGAEMVEQLDGLKDTANIIRYHHECFDGSGYPHRLAERAIPAEARLLAAADALEQLDYVDPERIGAMGWSYGGYMMNWLLGHTDRFEAIDTEDLREAKAMLDAAMAEEACRRASTDPPGTGSVGAGSVAGGSPARAGPM